MFNRAMAEIKSTRLARLTKALDVKRLEKSERARFLSQSCGGGISYWSGLLSGARPFGEKAARKVESALSLPHCWLDDEVSPATIGPEAMMLARAFDLVPDQTTEQQAKRDVLFGNLSALIDLAIHGSAGTPAQAQPAQPTPLPALQSKTPP